MIIRPNSSPSYSGPRKEASGIRRVVDDVVGMAGQVVGGVTAALPGALVGGLYATEWKRPPEERHTRELGALLQAGMSVASSVAQQTGTEWLLGVPSDGLSASNWTTAAVGSAWQYYSGGSGNIAQRIYDAVDRSAQAEQDTPTVVGRGLIHGFLEGAKGGAYEGKMQGIGLVEGAIEGSRDGWQALRGEWDPEIPPDPEPTSDSLARRLMSGGAGLMGGVMGASLCAFDGAVQGGLRGVMGSRPAQLNFPVSHKLQASLAGAVGGAFLLGPLGAACGMLVGRWAGSLLPGDPAPESSATSPLHRALDESFANDPDLGDSQANTYRNTVEGAMVGCVVGARSGMSLGRRSAQRIVSRLWEQGLSR